MTREIVACSTSASGLEMSISEAMLNFGNSVAKKASLILSQPCVTSMWDDVSLLVPRAALEFWPYPCQKRVIERCLQRKQGNPRRQSA